MKTQQTFRTMCYAAAAGLVLAAAGGLAGPARADVRINSHHHTNVRLDGDDVLITASDQSEARVTPAGDLYIEDKPVQVSDAQRKLLRQYNSGIHDIERRGIEIGKSAISLVGGVLSALVERAFADDKDDDEDMDERMRDKTSPLQEQAHELCKVAKAEHQLQDQIAQQLPAFKPYAVMEDNDDGAGGDCHLDHREV